jgi:hypothetical protein
VNSSVHQFRSPYFSRLQHPKELVFESLLPGLVLEMEMESGDNSHYGVTGTDALIVG